MDALVYIGYLIASPYQLFALRSKLAQLLVRFKPSTHDADEKLKLSQLSPQNAKKLK